MGNLWAEMQEVFNQQKQRSTASANRRRADYEFHVGQQVLVSQHQHQRLLRSRRHPLNPKAVGPFTIQRQITRNTFVRDIPPNVLVRSSPAFHSSELIPYESRVLHPEAGQALNYFKVLETPIPMVLGYTFLLKHQPDIDWKTRTLRFLMR